MGILESIIKKMEKNEKIPYLKIDELQRNLYDVDKPELQSYDIKDEKYIQIDYRTLLKYMDEHKNSKKIFLDYMLYIHFLFNQYKNLNYIKTLYGIFSNIHNGDFSYVLWMILALDYNGIDRNKRKSFSKTNKVESKKTVSPVLTKKQTTSVQQKRSNTIKLPKTSKNMFTSMFTDIFTKKPQVVFINYT